MATTPTYEIDYEDTRLTAIEDEKNQKLTAEETTYNGMIDNTDQFYQAQIDASKEWASQQSQIQQEQTDFTIEQIEQQKDQAQKDYTKEQAGAYVDWQKQSNQYGVNAEKIAAAGLAGTGFSESSQVSMYNTYQNRVATARESYNKAVLNYDNAIKDARLQNNAALAEIAANALQQQLELSLQGFQYKNQLISELSDKKMQVENLYNDKWKTQLDVMNKEIDRTWQADQNEIERQWQAEQSEIERQWKTTEAQLDRNFQSEQAKIERKFKEAQAELDRKHDKEMLAAQTKAEKEKLALQHQQDMAKLEKQKQNEIAILDKQLANEKAALKYEYDLVKSAKSTTTTKSTKSPSSKTTTTKQRIEKDNQFTNKSTANNQTTMQSILALGYGPISTSRLNELVASGAVEEYVDSNGVTKFRKKATNKSTPLGKYSGFLK